MQTIANLLYFTTILCISTLTCFGVPRGFAVDAPPAADLGASLDPPGLPLPTEAVGVCGFCTDLL